MLNFVAGFQKNPLKNCGINKMNTTENYQGTESKNEQEIVNKVILTGHLGKDPTVDTVGTNLRLAKFSLATTNNYKNYKGEAVKDTQWHNVVVWGKLANEVGEKLKKGNKLTLEGKINYKNYTDKAGVKKYYTEIVAHDLKFFERKEAA